MKRKSNIYQRSALLWNKWLCEGRREAGLASTTDELESVLSDRDFDGALAGSFLRASAIKEARAADF